MVEAGWEKDLSGSAAIADLRRCRGQQRESTPLVEAQPAALGGSGPATDHRLSLPARHQQVEQDRAPALFVYQSELEGTAADQLRNDHQSHRWHQDANWAQSQSRAGHE